MKDEDLNRVSNYIDEHTKATGESLFALVNNAGVSSCGALEWGKIEELQSVLDVNMNAGIKITRYFIPQLVKTYESRIITITSAITHGAIPLMSSYGISKVNHCTRNLVTKFSFLNYFRLE